MLRTGTVVILLSEQMLCGLSGTLSEFPAKLTFGELPCSPQCANEDKEARVILSESCKLVSKLFWKNLKLPKCFFIKKKKKYIM